MRLVPLTLYPPTGAATTHDYYTVRDTHAERAAIPDGPSVGGAITRLHGDRLPRPAPQTFAVEIPAATLADAYTAGRALIEAAKTAARVTWYAGAFDVAAVLRASIEPAGPDSVTVTLELLPSAAPTHYGLMLPVHTTTGWTARTGTTLAAVNAANTNPALCRPTTPALNATAATGTGYWTATHPIDAQPYDPDAVEILAVIRSSVTPGGGNGFGLLIETPTTKTAAYITATTSLLLNRDAYAVIASATNNPAPVAGEWWTFRVRATRVDAATTRLDLKAWSRRTHPTGEPAAWQVTATRAASDDPHAAGPYMAGIGQYVEVARMTTGTGGAPAPGGNI